MALWRLNTDNTNGSDDDKVAGGSFTFQGECYKCKGKGHKAIDCKKGKGSYNGNRNRKKSGKFNGSCNNCGKSEHKKADCWQLESNKDKQP